MSMSFVIATDEASKVKDTIASIRNIRGAEDQIVLVENANSIAEAYNQGIEQAKFERICFTHHDVELRPSDYWMNERLDALYDRYNIGFLGAAGSKDMFPDGRWFIDGNRLSGAVIHGQFFKEGQQIPQQAKRLPDGRYYAEWLSQYGNFGRCVVMDGVVLISTKAVLEDIGGFDAKTYPESWHYYDLDATLKAHKKGYHNIAVPLFIRHLGLGDSIHTDDWQVAHQQFVDKWGKDFPVCIEHESDYTIERLSNLRVMNQ